MGYFYFGIYVVLIIRFLSHSDRLQLVRIPKQNPAKGGHLGAKMAPRPARWLPSRILGPLWDHFGPIFVRVWSLLNVFLHFFTRVVVNVP